MTLDEALDRFPGAYPYKPGDSAERNAEALAQMRSGKRTAGSAALAEYSREGFMPEPERIGIALDWTGRPVFAIKTLEVELLRYCDMDEARVLPQAEFDDLADWRRGCAAYFRDQGGFDSEMEMIFVRFEVIEELGGAPHVS
ncbi:hypothetical protein RGUI_0440 [Rhodovulum sp. P5]|uniref:ASCH domain-containing protein n=1 Tax=Rhodovulum sp. P5 TaxID=1564506 RepID=UPI0009C1B467|nr:ASCH domain-containing protein [Rhodovulum sp. P5]ARE38581.1 hypothetical protein RGUI_0440 [Rhodovulum sp. P5]